jgi:molybdopterin-guanine dinucleotide biosynthesis protein A
MLAEPFAGESLTAAYVLAGGASSRMGTNKALLEFCGEALVVRQLRVLREAGFAATILGQPAVYEKFGAAVLPDEIPGFGPLGGIVTALAHSARDWNLIVAVDLPYLTPEWLQALAERALESESADVIIPRSERGLEPLSAVYHRRALGVLRAALDAGVHKVSDALVYPPGCRLLEISPAEWKRIAGEPRLFENINTMADYRKATTGGRI